MKNNKEKKKNNESKECNDIIPGEIIEKRKVSKSKNLSIKYNCIKTIKPYDIEITCILFLKSSNIIITSSLDPQIETWTFESGDSNLKLLSILEGHSMSVFYLKEFPNLNCIASCSKDNTLKLKERNYFNKFKNYINYSNYIIKQLIKYN